MQKLKKNFCLFFVISSLSFEGQAQITPIYRVPGKTPYPNAKPLSDKASCTFKDLSPKMGPVRQQTGASCYAYAAMELLSYGSGKKNYSALHLAGQMGLGGGNASGALRAAFKNGVCPESLVPSVKLMREEYEGMIESFNRSKKNTMEVCNLILGSPIEYVMKQNLRLAELIEKGRVGKSSWEELEFWVKLSFPKYPSEKLMAVYSESDNYSEFIQKLNIEACKGKTIKLPRKKVKEFPLLYAYSTEGGKEGNLIFEEDRKKLFKGIALALDDSRPVAIGFHAGGLILEDTVENIHANHSSVIAGRTWRKGVCYYLIKNSWGPKWKPSKDLKALASKKHPGYFLVSEQSLMEHTIAATYLED